MSTTISNILEDNPGAAKEAIKIPGVFRTELQKVRQFRCVRAVRHVSDTDAQIVDFCTKRTELGDDDAAVAAFDANFLNDYNLNVPEERQAVEKLVWVRHFLCQATCYERV
jgi:hypothetical protein